MDDIRKAEMSSSRGAQMMASLPPLSWFTKPADNEWTQGGHPYNREASEYMYAMPNGPGFIPCPRYPIIRKREMVGPPGGKYPVVQGMGAPSIMAGGPAENSPCIIMQGPQMFIMNSVRGPVAVQQQQLLQAKAVHRYPYKNGEQLLCPNVAMIKNEEFDDSPSSGYINNHGNAVRMHSVQGIHGTHGMQVKQAMSQVQSSHIQTKSKVGSPLDLTKRNPMGIHPRQRRISAPGQLQEISHNRHTVCNNENDENPEHDEARQALNNHMKSRHFNITPHIPGMRPLMPLNSVRPLRHQFENVQRPDVKAKERSDIANSQAHRKLESFGPTLMARSSHESASQSQDSPSLRPSQVSPSLGHVLGRPQTTQELQRLQSPNSWSKHPCLMMDDLVSQSVPTVSRLHINSVPQKPSMSEVPLKNKSKTPSESSQPLAPKPWLPAKFPFQAMFTTTLTTSQNPLPVVPVPADSLITGRCVHRVRTGTAVSCAKFGVKSTRPVCSESIRAPVMNHNSHYIKIPTKCSSLPMRPSLPLSKTRSHSPNVIFSENPEECLSYDLLPFTKSDLHDTFNDIPTEDSSVSEYLSDTDLSISNLSTDSFSEELIRDISASGFPHLEASRLSLSSSGIDRLIIDESYLSANNTFQAPHNVSHNDSHNFSHNVSHDMSHNASHNVSHNIPNCPDGGLFNTSDSRPPSVLSNSSDISYNSNQSSPTNSKPPYKLSTHATSIMSNWFANHADHPYPNNAEKADLALFGGITVSQVSSWFTNTRRRSKRKKTPDDQQEVSRPKRQRHLTQ